MNRKNILLALRTYYPQIHVGVANYARSAGWHLHVMNNISLSDLEDWDGDGVITQERGLNEHADQKDAIESLTQPKIRIQIDVDTNGYEIGKMAANYFLDSGFRSFGCYAPVLPDWAPRIRGFWESIPDTKEFEKIDIKLSQNVKTWIQRKQSIQKHLTDCEHPLAVYAVDDMLAAEVMESALDAGLSVPEDVAVLGVDNNELICETLAVPLSSIDNNLEKVGYESARLLDGLLDGKSLPDKRVLIMPSAVVVRRSTDVLAVSHPHVARALCFIRDHFHEDISIQDIVLDSGMSQRALYYAFKRHMHHTVGDEITHVRLRHAEELLAKTDLKIATIAEESGFGTSLNLYRTFYKKHTLSPSDWRKRFD